MEEFRPLPAAPRPRLLGRPDELPVEEADGPGGHRLPTGARVGRAAATPRLPEARVDMAKAAIENVMAGLLKESGPIC